MANRIYTVLIVSKGGKAPRGFQVSLRAVLSFLLFLCLFTGGLSMLVKSHSSLMIETARLSGVDEENAGYRADLERLEGEFQQLLVQVAGLEALGREVRVIVSGEAEAEAEAGETEADEEIRVALQSRSAPRTGANLEDTLSYLLETIPQRTAEMTTLLSDAEQYRIRMAHTPDFWPVEGRVTSAFGWRRAPLSLRRHFHNGIDIGKPSGTPVKAAADGVVKEARYRSGWGNLIIIDHGIYTTYYAHLRRIGVKAGTIIEKGQIIGEVGSTGYSTGPHLHFEIHENGTPIDPLLILEREAYGSGV
jgi:murein DD-endopeptidase MepM/ murein hydrolase activator NlpD